MCLSSLIELCANGFDPLPRSAVGFAVLRADAAPFFQTQENVKGAVRQDMPLTCEAGDCAYFTTMRPFMMDGPTKGKFVQNTLFVL